LLACFALNAKQSSKGFNVMRPLGLHDFFACRAILNHSFSAQALTGASFGCSHLPPLLSFAILIVSKIFPDD
jgi:sulfite exporter TauE/SafE